MKRLGLSFAAFLFATAFSSAAIANTIVAPNAFTTVLGNAPDTNDGGTGFDFRAQELIGPGQFASTGGPILISGVAFRSYPGAAPIYGPVLLAFNSLAVYLSTSPKLPGTMSTTYTDNIGPDQTLVFSGPLTLSSPGCAGPAPCPFDMLIPFTTPFLYNFSSGSLLIDLRITALTESDTGALDAVSFNFPPGGPIATVSGPLSDATGGFDAEGDIFQVTYTPAVPEPASLTLLLAGIVGLAAKGFRQRS
jgi:hypothetical protein